MSHDNLQLDNSTITLKLVVGHTELGIIQNLPGPPYSLLPAVSHDNLQLDNSTITLKLVVGHTELGIIQNLPGPPSFFTTSCVT